jgi:hypothetical protein
MAPEWFEASKNVVGGLAYPANKYGRVIYEGSRSLPVWPTTFGILTP